MKKVLTPSLDGVVIPPVLLDLGHEIREAGGRVFLVGGWVRDTLLGIPSDDFDLEVYHLGHDALLEILHRHGRPNLVGRAFGIVHMRIGDLFIDVAFPRTESKVAQGHKGFLVTPDPNLTYEVASARRDFTINAMGVELPDLGIIDCHGGLADLEAGILRHVSAAFGEDPLRVLRAVQFAARFEMDVAPKTIALCRTLPLEELSHERIHDELVKLLLKPARPSIGLDLMRRMDVLRYFPELEALVGLPQDEEWHPEGDVWTHTLMVVDEAAALRNQLATEKEQLAFMFGALCHDLGKAVTTKRVNGRWVSPAHDVAGEALTRSFMARLTNEHHLVDEVVAYVREHLQPIYLYHARGTITSGAFRRLALRFPIHKVALIGRADHLGRTTPEALLRVHPAGDWLLEQARLHAVDTSRPTPLLTGRMLMGLGLRPGPLFGRLIRQSFELQLEGRITSSEDAREWARARMQAQGRDQDVSTDER